MNPETRNCQNCKLNFTIEPDDFSFYEKMKVPSPTFCPECRLIRRMATFNVRNIYNRKCDNCGGNTVSIFNPKAPYKNWCFGCYFSDEFDPSLYGTDYDFSTNFFTQYEKLRRNVPIKQRLKAEVKKKEQIKPEVRLRRTLERLGPPFIKFGQLLSVRPDLIPVSYTIELEKLQDRVSPFSYNEVEKIIKTYIKKH